MAPPRNQERASFFTQADALLRKNLSYQTRNMKQNITLTIFPALLCLLIISIESVVNSELSKPKFRCGCECVRKGEDGTCHNICGLEFSTLKQAPACPIRRPEKWPALMQVPDAQYRAVRTDSHPFPGLPDKSCMKNRSCPVTSLFTGHTKSIARSLARRIVMDAIPENAVDLSTLTSLLDIGASNSPPSNNFVESAVLINSSLHMILPNCFIEFNFTFPITLGNKSLQQEIDCARSLLLWRKNSSMINKELFQGYRNGNSFNEIHEYAVAYDFLDSRPDNFNVTIWYNSTYSNMVTKFRVLRVPKSINMVSNAFLHYFKAKDLQVLLGFVKEMPTPGRRKAANLSQMIGPLLYSWVIQLLLPVFLMFLVDEKQKKVRIMIRAHGLGDGPYFLVSYSYFFLVSSLYMIWFATFGCIIGLDIFRLNSYMIQFIFYVIYLNLQIVLAYVVGTAFSQVKTAAVVGYVYVFGSGLLGAFLFQYFIEHPAFSRWRLIAMETYPGFALYRGLYELSQYALEGHYKGTSGMNLEKLLNSNNGLKETMVIMVLEWLILLRLSYYLDLVLYSKNEAIRYSSNSSKRFHKGTIQPTISSKITSSTIVEIENSDIYEEIRMVEHILNEQRTKHPIICCNLEKVYKGKDGNPNKHAIHSISLAVSQGECFGLLGPNGSGKTTFISMVTGLLQPTSGTVVIDNTDIRSEMDKTHTKIGVCTQEDVLWDTLTGKEHLLFYGRLRNLKGSDLQHAVDHSLKSMNLYEDDVCDQLVGKYSGGMKRRLSVAISLIGDAKVVFLDEPATGLDPESRHYLWHAIKMAKRDRAIVLTTHSMEEAEFLCDRLGILVNGRLQCIGSSKQLKARYGRSYLLSISADPLQKKDIEQVVINLCPNAVKVYETAGTQKFQLPKNGARVSDIFGAMENIKREMSVHGFGLESDSLEDVFVNVVDQTVGVQIDQHSG